MNKLLKLITPESVKLVWGLLLIYCIIELAKTSAGIYLVCSLNQKHPNHYDVYSALFGLALYYTNFGIKCVFFYLLNPTKIMNLLNQYLNKEENNNAER